MNRLSHVLASCLSLLFVLTIASFTGSAQGALPNRPPKAPTAKAAPAKNEPTKAAPKAAALLDLNSATKE